MLLVKCFDDRSLNRNFYRRSRRKSADQSLSTANRRKKKIESIALKSVSYMFEKRTRPPDTRRVAAGPILEVIEDLCGDRTHDIALPYSRCTRPPVIERLADIHARYTSPPTSQRNHLRYGDELKSLRWRAAWKIKLLMPITPNWGKIIINEKQTEDNAGKYRFFIRMILE